jgi:hypothetical protein
VPRLETELEIPESREELLMLDCGGIGIGDSPVLLLLDKARGDCGDDCMPWCSLFTLLSAVAFYSVDLHFLAHFTFRR